MENNREPKFKKQVCIKTNDPTYKEREIRKILNFKEELEELRKNGKCFWYR